jgi:hypothetical protein
MADDPFPARRRGVRRVRVLTASVAAAAAVGTGAVVAVMSSARTAQADDAPAGVQTSSDDGGFSTPAQAPGGYGGSDSGSGGLGSDASSGGS